MADPARQTTDILTRLQCSHPDTLTDDEVVTLLRDGAAEIVRLRADGTHARDLVERLRQQLADEREYVRSLQAALGIKVDAADMWDGRRG